MTMPTITEIENAIIERLRACLPYLRTCGSLSGFTGRSPEVIEAMAPLCPAAFVIYRQGTFSLKMSGVQDRLMLFGVVAAVRNLRGESALRHGSTGQKGIYEVLEDVRSALSEQSCGIDVEPFAPVTEEAFSGTRDFAVYEILFRTGCRVAP